MKLDTNRNKIKRTNKKKKNWKLSRSITEQQNKHKEPDKNSQIKKRERRKRRNKKTKYKRRALPIHTEKDTIIPVNYLYLLLLIQELSVRHEKRFCQVIIKSSKTNNKVINDMSNEYFSALAEGQQGSQFTRRSKAFVS